MIVASKSLARPLVRITHGVTTLTGNSVVKLNVETVETLRSTMLKTTTPVTTQDHTYNVSNVQDSIPPMPRVTAIT